MKNTFEHVVVVTGLMLFVHCGWGTSVLLDGSKTNSVVIQFQIGESLNWDGAVTMQATNHLEDVEAVKTRQLDIEDYKVRPSAIGRVEHFTTAFDNGFGRRETTRYLKGRSQPIATQGQIKKDEIIL